MPGLPVQWSDKTARVWIPNAGIEAGDAPPMGSLPLLLVHADDPDGIEGLLVVVNSRAQLAAAEDAAVGGRTIVIWAWHCPEYIAQEAEDSFPVVFGQVGLGDVAAAEQRGPGRSELTSLCMAAEMALGFPDVLQ